MGMNGFADIGRIGAQLDRRVVVRDITALQHSIIEKLVRTTDAANIRSSFALKESNIERRSRFGHSPMTGAVHLPTSPGVERYLFTC